MAVCTTEEDRKTQKKEIEVEVDMDSESEMRRDEEQWMMAFFRVRPFVPVVAGTYKARSSISCNEKKFGFSV